MTAATPPSPTGTVPPAADALRQPEPVPVAEQTRADAPGGDEVSPDAETTPMAVILGDRPPAGDDGAPSPSAPARAAAPRMRGPFEPANNLRPPPADPPAPRPSAARGPAAAGTGSGTSESAPRSSKVASSPVEASPADAPERSESGTSAGSATAAKLDQIKDLYLAAEAIGEDALDQHFQLVSDRQRQLIRDYFDRAVPGRADTSEPGS